MIWWLVALTVALVANLAWTGFLWLENGAIWRTQRVVYKMVRPLYDVGILVMQDRQPERPNLSVVNPEKDK